MHVFMHGSHGKHGHDHSHAPDEKKEESFQELTDKNAAYHDGYIQGLEKARKESHKKESSDEWNIWLWLMVNGDTELSNFYLFCL